MMCKQVTFDVDFCLAYEKVGLCGAPSHSVVTPILSFIFSRMHTALLFEAIRPMSGSVQFNELPARRTETWKESLWL